MNILHLFLKIIITYNDYENLLNLIKNNVNYKNALIIGEYFDLIYIYIYYKSI
jgi:hypothetical protein